MTWPTKKLGEIHLKLFTILILVLVIIHGLFNDFFKVDNTSVLLLLILILLPYLPLIKKIKFGDFEAELQIPPENIKRDIVENNRPVTKKTFDTFKEVEENVLNEIQGKLGGVMKKQINFMYGMPDKPEFIYRPDATIQTESELIFIEVKYVLKPEFAPKIVENAFQYLKTILEKFGPSAGKKLSAKLVLASGYNINLKSFKVPEGIDLEFYKL